MKRTHHHIKRKTKIMLLKMLVDAVIKFVGIACFFIGIGALAEVPTDPKKIVQALGLFILGICIIGYNSYLITKQESKNDRFTK